MKKRVFVPLCFFLFIIFCFPVQAYADAPALPATPKLTSVKALSKQRIKVKWKKAARATSYQVEYSTSPSFRPVYDIVKTKNTNITFSCPYGNTRIYVRVCAIRTKNHFSQYGFWSSSKSVYLNGAKPSKFSAAQLKKIKKWLNVPSSLKVTYSQGKPYFWTAGGRWLTNVIIYNKKKQMVASAACDSFTASLIRNIGTYGFAGYK